MRKLKRYLVFEIWDYYPGGGFLDFAGDTDTEEEAISLAMKFMGDAVDIVDSHNVKNNGHPLSKSWSRGQDVPEGWE